MQHRKRCWNWGHGLSHDIALLALSAGKMIYRVIINLILISIWNFVLYRLAQIRNFAVQAMNVSVHVLYGAVEV